MMNDSRSPSLKQSNQFASLNTYNQFNSRSPSPILNFRPMQNSANQHNSWNDLGNSNENVYSTSLNSNNQYTEYKQQQQDIQMHSRVLPNHHRQIETRVSYTSREKTLSPNSQNYIIRGGRVSELRNENWI